MQICGKKWDKTFGIKSIKEGIAYLALCFLQAQCQSLKINNCPQLIEEFGAEAVRRDNICKTQCSFVLNSLLSGEDVFFGETDTLQAPGAGSHTRPHFPHEKDKRPRQPKRQPPPKKKVPPRGHPPHPPPLSRGKPSRPLKGVPPGGGPFPTGLGVGAGIFAGRPPPTRKTAGAPTKILPPPPPPRIRSQQQQQSATKPTVFPAEEAVGSAQTASGAESSAESSEHSTTGSGSSAGSGSGGSPTGPGTGSSGVGGSGGTKRPGASGQPAPPPPVPGLQPQGGSASGPPGSLPPGLVGQGLNGNLQGQGLRQPRPLFSFLPRLPNLSELFGL